MDDAAPLRTVLFVPGDSQSKLQKALGLEADALVADLEDAVGAGRKPAARETVAAFFGDHPRFSGTLMIRCNPRTSPHFAEDCRMAAAARPDAVVLPKCESPEDVLEGVHLLGGEFPIIAMIESARALLRAREIAESSPRIAALAFGAEDFSADLGITRTPGEPELLYARSALVTMARAADKLAIDSPSLDFRDLDAVRDAGRRARNFGFSGKFAIHPAQLPILNELFLPTDAEAAEARRVIEASTASQGGAAAVDGRMVDVPVVRRARRVLSLRELREAPRPSPGSTE